MGPYDIIVEIDVPNLVDVPPILSTKIRTISGIQSTTSLVSFPEPLIQKPGLINRARHHGAGQLGSLSANGRRAPGLFLRRNDRGPAPAARRGSWATTVHPRHLRYRS